jgi:hypothetical protein
MTAVDVGRAGSLTLSNNRRVASSQVLHADEAGPAVLLGDAEGASELPVVGKEILSQRTADYQNWVEAFARNQYADHLTEKVHDLLGPREPAEVAVNDNAVEAVVDERKQVAEQLGEQLHGNPLQTRSGSKTHQASTRQADCGGQEFSSGR